MDIHSANDVLDLIERIHTPNKSPADWTRLLHKLRSTLSSDIAICIEVTSDSSGSMLVHRNGCEREPSHEALRDVICQSECGLSDLRKYYPVTAVISKDHPFAETFFGSLELEHGLVIDCIIHGEAALRLFVGRRPHKSAFAPHEIYFFKAMAQHFTESLHTRKNLLPSLTGSRITNDFLDNIPIAVLIVEQDLRVRFRSQRASNFFGRNSLFYTNSFGRLETENPECLSMISIAIKALLHMAETERSSAAEIVTFGHYHILLRLLQDETHCANVALFIFDSESKSAPDSAILKKLFNFTDAEARIATFLSQGLSIDDVKNILNISRHTARNHLRSIFTKCGVTRQSNLIRKIVTSPAMLN